MHCNTEGHWCAHTASWKSRGRLTNRALPQPDRKARVVPVIKWPTFISPGVASASAASGSPAAASPPVRPASGSPAAASPPVRPASGASPSNSSHTRSPGTSTYIRHPSASPSPGKKTREGSLVVDDEVLQLRQQLQSMQVGSCCSRTSRFHLNLKQLHSQQRAFGTNRRTLHQSCHQPSPDIKSQSLGLISRHIFADKSAHHPPIICTLDDKRTYHRQCHGFGI